MKQTKLLNTPLATYGVDWLYILFLYIYATIAVVVLFRLAGHLTLVLVVMGILYGITLKVLQNHFP